MIPKDILQKIVSLPPNEGNHGGQRTNGTPSREVTLELEGMCKITVNCFSLKKDNENLALTLMEFLLIEANVI